MQQTSDSNQKSDPGDGRPPGLQARLMLELCTLGFLIRVALIFISEGSNDLANWKGFSTFLQVRSQCELYAATELCNNPPLIGLWGKAAFRAAHFYGVRFAPVFKTLGLLFEILTA